MAPKVRDRIINALIMSVSGIVVSIVTITINSSKVNANEIESKIESKVDKVVFNEFKIENKKDHEIIENKVIKHMDSRFSDFKDFMIELNKKR